MRKNLTSVVLAILVLQSGCTGLKRRSELGAPAPATGEVVGAGPTFSTQHPPAKGSSAPTHHTPKIGLILGPGGAKAFAQVGVLKEFARARIPVSRIIGIEWGALVGGLFAQKGQIHEVEWKAYKLEQRDFPSRGFLSSEVKPESIQTLWGFLQDNLAGSSATAIAFACPTMALTSGVVTWQERGDLATSVRRCVAYPPLFTGDEGLVAASFAMVEAAQKLRQEGAELIIAINVLGSTPMFSRGQLPENSSSAILWHELRRAVRLAQPLVNEWIEVDTAKFDVLSFDKRRDLVRAGEVAGQQAARRLADQYGF